MSTTTVVETTPLLHAEATACRPVAAWQTHAAESFYHRWKFPLDWLAAALLLAPAAPVIFALIVVVRLTSRGPGIFRQRRIGRRGREFMMYKIRTMRCDAEAEGGAQWCQGAQDPRVTPIGRFIRKFHLDEFPQLVNVLRGEMSLMGPRPERPEFVEVLSQAIPGYSRRHQIRPGITGLAQINLPPDTDLDSVRRKLALDIDYVENASLGLDARMFLSTALRLVGLHGERTLRTLGVSRAVPCVKSACDSAPAAGPLTPVAVAVPHNGQHINTRGTRHRDEAGEDRHGIRQAK